MKKTVNLVLFALIAVLPLGELLRFTFPGSVSIRVVDCIAILLSLLTLLTRISDCKKSVKNNVGYVMLAGVLVLSYLWSFGNSSTSSLLYLFRALLYLQLPISIDLLVNDTNIKTIKKLLSFSFALLVISAIAQYFLYPPLQNIAYLGFDPHYYRAVGLLMDPNLIGTLFVFIILFLLHGKKTVSAMFLTAITIITLFLTQSRISLLALGLGAVLLMFRKQINTHMLLICVSVLTLAFMFIPKQLGEGNRLLRTNSIVAKTEAWQLGISLWQDNPLLGIGFNNSHLYKPTQKRIFGNIEVRDNSFYGLDSTILTLLVTSGVLGVLAYLYLFRKLVSDKSVLASTLATVFFIHTFSTNSFFTPTVFVFFVILYRITRQK